MADPKRPPRRISKAYILGFSNKPFKDLKPPIVRPRRVSAMDQLLSTPGGLVEWAASDGRKGKLTGPGTARQTEESVPKAPSKAPSKRGSVKSKTSAKAQEPAAKSSDDDAGGIFDLFNQPAGGSDDKPKAPEPKAQEPTSASNWTAEEDKKLMDWKSEHPNAAWAVFADENGKTKEECQKRFKEIKPSDWKPTAAGGKGSGGGKKGNNQGQNQSKSQKGQNQKKEDKKIEDSGTTTNNQADTANINWDDAGGNSKDYSMPCNDTNWDNAGPSGTNGNIWETTSNQNDTPWPDEAAATPPPSPPKPASEHRKSSHKSSRHRSSGAQQNVADPIVLEVKPGDGFSADDLCLIAKILQQDTKMLWDRVSWRFSDKTGRYLAPDDIEKKITGVVESKEKEMEQEKEKREKDKKRDRERKKRH